ncbi:transcriptional repressor [Kocuria coralli]|uniref:Transcriptional repressor n=1 Tax=Kocuria coralli TaxID=1461025 RepID=A0A5J5L1B4_9MICC|nr:transcriptional repressor [Kocuria coralli]KAA9395633.1 transcriptional repressor [Kocuria coralli]
MSSADSPASKEARGEIRNTRQRRAVRAALDAQTDFISTQDLHNRLREQGDSVSLATTYRVLQSMADTGEVDVLRNAEGEAIYRKCAAEHHHHHLVCRVCGATVELEAPLVEAWAEQTASAFGYTNLDHTIEIVGLCPRCQEQADADPSSPEPATATDGAEDLR